MATTTSTNSSKVLVVTRLSRITDDDQNRTDRDSEDASQWAAREGFEVVHVTRDEGVSGSIPPWDRPELGPYLTDLEKVASYDVIWASSIDRLARSVRDLHDLKRWAEDHGKTVHVHKPELMWPAPEGLAGMGYRVLWDVLAELAELELTMTKERQANARVKVSANSGFIGKPPFGFRVTGERYARVLELDPVLEPYLRGMVERALRGDTLSSIGKWLDSEGIRPTTKSTRKRRTNDGWHHASVTKVLRSPALKGRRMSEDGRTVLHKHEGIMTPAEWNELQQALDGRSSRRGPTSVETALLTGSITCALCAGPMWRHKRASTRKETGTTNSCFYYRCTGTSQEPSKCRNMIRLTDVEQWVNDWFTITDTVTLDGDVVLGSFGNTEIVELVTVNGHDHADEIAELELELRGLNYDAPDFLTKQSTLMAERNRLKSLPVEPSKLIERPTGVKVGDAWARLDDAARRRYLLAAGVKVQVRPLQKNEAGGINNHAVWLEGDPHKVIGTLQRVVEPAA